MKAVNSLEKYVEIDNLIIFKNDNSDFVDFCNNHNDNIINVCECIREIKSYINGINENEFENESEYNLVMHYMREIKEIIKKVID